MSLTNDEGYSILRENYNNSKNPLELFVLICYCFNHQIRFNNSGKFNTPFGKERSCYNSNIEKNLILFVNTIKEQDIEFMSGDFMTFDYSKLDNSSFV